MFYKTLRKIVIIGTGNVATHFAKAIKNGNYQLLQIISRNAEKHKELSKILNVSINNFNEISKNADLYIIACPDDAIIDVIKQFSSVFNNKIQGLVVHCSGTVHINIFKKNKLIQNYGVIYPFKSLLKTEEYNFNNSYFFIEANSKENTEKIKSFTKTITQNIFETNSENRAIIHLSGVFANNFTNHIIYIAKQILKENNIPDEALNELIKQTFLRFQNKTNKSILALQTGPAIRKDKKTIEKHLQLLKKHPQWQKIYKDISLSIMKTK